MSHAVGVLENVVAVFADPRGLAVAAFLVADALEALTESPSRDRDKKKYYHK